MGKKHPLDISITDNPISKARARVYVAGAYNAKSVMKVLANMRRGLRLSKRVFKTGFAPFIPWIDYHLPLMDGSIRLKDMYEYSISWLPVAQAMIVVPQGYSNSAGTRAEIVHAMRLNIPVFFCLEDLIAWGKKHGHI